MTKIVGGAKAQRRWEGEPVQELRSEDIRNDNRVLFSFDGSTGG
jgi:hypothetical protein